MERGEFRRQGVSAEVYGSFNPKGSYVQKIIEKTKEQKERISNKILTSILFNNLEESEIEVVINAMEEVRLV